MKIGIYAGSFDPVTNGHLDIIQRSSKLFDRLYVVIMNNTSKHYLFTFREKQELLNNALQQLACQNVQVKVADNQLVADVAQSLNAQWLVRGLRSAADLNYEISMQQINRQQNQHLEIVYLVSQPQYMYVASSMIKEVVKYGGQVTDWVPEVVQSALRQKLGTKS
ncbi:pantetheine-phosphate adenylyltransferase [Bombilactobacillus bombi]|uniref:pantetheine-phosphate adenylyltransferase n=1 Tax=Bombilactobacillus bombi TaxID=1303590 RepID=UPI0015E5DB76|nr:pantetheine-phosphate adenylyltransferase [Bombilactobacillus bombi]MBA1434322.1 pantetheine-phosphate adenylyltransferase [Bombilactobacillus bombi]